MRIPIFQYFLFSKRINRKRKKRHFLQCELCEKKQYQRFIFNTKRNKMSGNDLKLDSDIQSSSIQKFLHFHYLVRSIIIVFSASCACADVHAYSKQIHRGSRDMKTHRSVSIMAQAYHSFRYYKFPIYSNCSMTTEWHQKWKCAQQNQWK